MKQKKIFWKVYWVIFSLLLVGIIGIFVILYQFLGVYEAAKPEKKMDELLNCFTSRDWSVLDYAKEDYPLDAKEDILEDLQERTADKTFSYRVAYGKFTPEKPVYTIYADDEEFVTVTLEPDAETGRFHSKIWKVQQIDGLVKVYDEYTILASSDYIVKNGETILTEEQIVERKELQLEDHYESYVQGFPELVVYQTPKGYKRPEITCVTEDGREVSEEKSEEYDVVFPRNVHEEPSQERKEEMERFVGHYVRFCMNEEELQDVLGYFIPGTVTYGIMKEMNIIRQYGGRHDRLELSEVTVEEYEIYHDEAYRAKLSFDYIRYKGDVVKHNPTVLELFYGKVDGEWKIVDMSINSK